MAWPALRQPRRRHRTRGSSRKAGCGEGVACASIDNIGKVLIDEVQDFRDSFRRLIKHLIHTNEDTQYMVVGDPRQMLYDYNEEDLASLDYIQAPETFFVSARKWSSAVLDVTHRLTPEMAGLGRMYGLQLTSAKPTMRPLKFTRSTCGKRVFCSTTFFVTRIAPNASSSCRAKEQHPPSGQLSQPAWHPHLHPRNRRSGSAHKAQQALHKHVARLEGHAKARLRGLGTRRR